MSYSRVCHNTTGSISTSTRSRTSFKLTIWLAEKGGFAKVHNREQYLLPPPVIEDGLEVYSISVFHQIHCLASIPIRARPQCNLWILLIGADEPLYNRLLYLGAIFLFIVLDICLYMVIKTVAKDWNICFTALII